MDPVCSFCDGPFKKGLRWKDGRHRAIYACQSCRKRYPQLIAEIRKRMAAKKPAKKLPKRSRPVAAFFVPTDAMPMATNMILLGITNNF